MVDALSVFQGQVAVIGTGYPDDINRLFFGLNEGLRRRFPQILTLPAYTPQQLLAIFENEVGSEINADVRKWLLKFLENNKSRITGQARDMKRLSRNYMTSLGR